MVPSSDGLRHTIEAPQSVLTTDGGEHGGTTPFSTSRYTVSSDLENSTSQSSSLDYIKQNSTETPSTAFTKTAPLQHSIYNFCTTAAQRFDTPSGQGQGISNIPSSTAFSDFSKISPGDGKDFVSVWGPKEKRIFQRIISGFHFRKSGERLRMMTLTTAVEGQRHLLAPHFSALVMRIKRKYKRFEYVKVNTSEGFGVMHVVFDGTYIPQRWLSEAWYDIHGSRVVDIRSVYRRKGKSLTSYLVSHLSTQPYARMSWSWGWVYRGFVKRWYLLRRHYKNRAVAFWKRHLRGEEIHTRDFVLRSNGEITSVSSVSLA